MHAVVKRIASSPICIVTGLAFTLIVRKLEEESTRVNSQEKHVGLGVFSSD